MLQAQSQPVALPTTFDESPRFEPEDGLNYKRRRLQIIQNLNLRFDATKAKQERGQLICEHDVRLTNLQTRLSTTAYFADEQIRNQTGTPTAGFCIEIISPIDEVGTIQRALTEHFKAGVRVVWHIYPESEVVYVHTALRTVQLCMEDDICSAQPVLDDFTITVNELLK